MGTEIMQNLIEYLNQISGQLPIPWFVFIGSFIEEIIAPIPSPLVMTLAGSLASAQKYPWIYLVLLAVVGAIGKTLASYILYVLIDKGEDLVMNKFGRFIGLSHDKVESIGKYLNKGWRDDLILILLRAIPIIPTAPVSVVCGLLKLNIRTYIISTFIGTTIRNIFYLFVGYAGINATEKIISELEGFEFLGYGLVFLTLIAIFGYIYYQRYKESILKKLFNILKKQNTDPE